jgi:hypothetical protein
MNDRHSIKRTQRSEHIDFIGINSVELGRSDVFDRNTQASELRVCGTLSIESDLLVAVCVEIERLGSVYVLVLT